MLDISYIIFDRLCRMLIRLVWMNKSWPFFLMLQMVLILIYILSHLVQFMYTRLALLSTSHATNFSHMSSKDDWHNSFVLLYVMFSSSVGRVLTAVINQMLYFLYVQVQAWSLLLRRIASVVCFYWLITKHRSLRLSRCCIGCLQLLVRIGAILHRKIISTGCREYISTRSPFTLWFITSFVFFINENGGQN